MIYEFRTYDLLSGTLNTVIDKFGEKIGPFLDKQGTKWGLILAAILIILILIFYFYF